MRVRGSGRGTSPGPPPELTGLFACESFTTPQGIRIRRESMSLLALRRVLSIVTLAITCGVAPRALAQEDDQPQGELEQITAMTNEAVALINAKKFDEGIAVLARQLEAIK